MSLLRRIVQNRTVSKSIPVAKLFVPYPLGRNHSSLPKINPNFDQLFFDRRPISLRYRVTTMIELSNPNEAAKISHLAVSDKFRGNGDTVFICNSVIGAMCSAKRYDEALSLFNYFFNEFETLPNMLSCNLIMKAHCDLGRVDDALELYRHVLLDGVLAPGVETYRILTKGFVDAKLFDEACDFVSSMSRWDFAVYDILIRGFLDSGKFVKASLILEEVKNVNSRLPWREYHKGIAMFNVSFMNYWFKLGKDEEAMEIYAALDKSEAKNLIVGNRVLEVLVEHGKKTEAWDLFKEMVEICDSETVEIMLKGFSATTIPVHRVRKTCYRALIAGFCKEGNMSEAEKLFAEMVSDIERDELIDISTFRALINGYVNAGRVDDAIKMLDKMKIAIVRKLAIHEATCPRALMSRVNYLASGGSLDAAVKYARLAVFSDIEVKVWPHNEEEDEIEFICESIIGSMVEYKRHKDAHDLYDFFFKKHNLKPNMHCCNYILKSRFEQGLVDEALDFHRSAVAFGYPNEDTFRILTKGLVHSGRLDQAETAPTTDSSRFHQCNLVDLNTMIQCLLDLWNLDRANKVLKRVWFEFPDDVTLNTLIRGFLDLGNLDKANLVSDELKQLCFQFPDHVAFNYLIRGFLDLGNLDKANLVLSEFKRLWSVTTALSKHSPDSEHENRVAFLMATFMEYWFKQGKEVEAMEIYDRSLFANKFPIDAQTGNAFLEVLFKYGKKEHAWELYREMFDQHDDESLSRGMDMSTVKKMVDECFDMGRCSEAVETYKKAIAKNKFVRGSYIIKRCCEIGMLSEAESLLADGYPNMEKATFKTMMDAYVKAGRIDDAIKTSNKMIDAALEDLPDLF